MTATLDHTHAARQIDEGCHTVASRIAFKPCSDHSCHNMHPTAGSGLVSKCEDLNPIAQTARCRQGVALADDLGALLELVEDFQGTLSIAVYISGRRSTESCA